MQKCGKQKVTCSLETELACIELHISKKCLNKIH